MPRDGSNLMSKLPGTAAVTGQTIDSADYNATIDDIISDLNAIRPVAYGGTGVGSLAALLSALGIGDTADILYRDVAGQTVSGGAKFTAFDLGTKTTGTLTIDVSNGMLQTVIDGGAFTLAVDTTKLGWTTLVVTNNGSAGAIDITAFGSNVFGENHVTTNAAVFAFDIRVLSSSWVELAIRKKA